MTRVDISPKFRAALIGAATLAAAGCAVGPDFKSPAAPQTDRYTAEPVAAATAATPAEGGASQAFAIGKQLPARWWTLFQSDALNRLVDDAFNGSPTVTVAEATLRQAQENLTATRAQLLPAFDGSASATRQKISGAQFGGQPNIFSLFDASVGVSYGIDLFGGARRAAEAQTAAVEYQRFEVQAAYQTLAANVVTAAVTEASLRAQVAATGEIVAALQHQTDVIEKQYRLGGAAYSDVLSARSNLASEQATLPGLRKQLEQTRHRLAVYLGKLPNEFVAPPLDIAGLQLPRELPVTLPSELVRQRPDVRAAEAQMHEAAANIGVATAALLPQIGLSGSFGDEASKVGDLFSNGIWSIGANVTQPLFHGGELRAKRRGAVDAYDVAAAQYRQTVLTSFAEVADALRALEADAQAFNAQYTASTSAEANLRLVEKQYALGAVSYLNLLTAQNQYQQARINYVQALANRYQDTVALFQALGGDWNDASVRTVAAAPAAPAGASPAQPNPTTRN
jgi:NodT family efflux transporter outer membrane factor (OMF) lipoprotein